MVWVVGVRVIQVKGKAGWYVDIDRPKWVRERTGAKSKIVRRKAGATQSEAKRNALAIEAELLKQWESIRDPLGNAQVEANTTGARLDEVVDDLMRAAGWSKSMRDRVVAAMSVSDEERQRQGIEDVAPELKGVVAGLAEDVSTWQQWVKLRTLDQRGVSQSTIRNWETKLKGLAEWLGHDHVGVIDRKQAFDYKLQMLTDKEEGTVLSYIASLSGLWNWAITSGQLKGENVWTGLKKGLSSESSKQPIEGQALVAAAKKADDMKDIRFWFGRYQGLRKEDYCGLRWCDLDLKERVLHLKQYQWTNEKGRTQRRNLKMKKRGERTIPIHSELLKKLELYLPEAMTNDSTDPIWADDYRPSIEGWGSRFSERFTDRYGFGTHQLRSYVVTQLLLQNVSPYLLKELTGHSVPGLGKVVAGYVRPTIEEVRQVLEKIR